MEIVEFFPKKKENFENQLKYQPKPVFGPVAGAVAVDMSGFRPSICPVFGRRYVQFSAVDMSSGRRYVQWTQNYFAVRRVITD